MWLPLVTEKGSQYFKGMGIKLVQVSVKIITKNE